MASDIARLGRAGVAGLPGSKSQAQIFLQTSLSLSVARAEGRAILFTSLENDRKRASVQSMRRLAPGRRGGGFEHHAPILPEAVRVAIYQYELQFAAGPAGDVPPAASSPLETAAAPGRDPGYRPHSGLGGKSPNQVAAEWDGGNAANGAARTLRGVGQALPRGKTREGEKDWRRTGAGASRAERAVRRRIGRVGIALEGARFVAVELGAYVGRDMTVFHANFSAARSTSNVLAWTEGDVRQSSERGSDSLLLYSPSL